MELRSPGTAEAKLGPLVFIVKEEEEEDKERKKKKGCTTTNASHISAHKTTHVETRRAPCQAVEDLAISRLRGLAYCWDINNEQPTGGEFVSLFPSIRFKCSQVPS